jgi:HJR/Mrr/RecB family endonuclease
MTATAAINYALPSAAPQKFKKQPGESVQMKGNLSLTVGEAGIKNLLTGKYQVTECTVYLTNQRFVATKARQYFPWGPLVWLIRAFFARKIIFSIPLTELAAIKLDPAEKTRMILQSTSGQEFSVVSTTLFNSQPKWVAALTSAVTQSAPGTTSQQTESAITFARA